MSDSSVLSRYGITPPAASPAETPDRKPFSVLRATGGQELMLDVRFNTGDREGFAYAYLMKVKFNPSGSITAIFTTDTVVIEGRNLLPLFDGLLIHAVRFVQEENAIYDLGGEQETFITRIEIAEN